MAADTALCISASSKIIKGDFPPSSSVTRFSWVAAPERFFYQLKLNLSMKFLLYADDLLTYSNPTITLNYIKQTRRGSGFHKCLS
jgi:hypothetical protein